MSLTEISRLTPQSGPLRITGYLDGEIQAYYDFLPHDILVIRDVIPFAQELIDKANSLNLWTGSTIYKNGQLIINDTVRNNTRISVLGTVHPELETFRQKLSLIMHSAMKLYMLDNDYVRVSKDEGFQLLKYEKGQHYYPHSDSGEGSYHRLVSAVGVLNTGYKGGELYFPRQNITIQPEAGSIVVFPSFYTHIHESKDVTEGTKYSVVTWFS